MDIKELTQLRDHYEWSFDTAQEWGLEPYPIDFHVVPANKMYEIASYGIPGHFSHWTYGRDYWKQKTGYDYGLSRIYELVINSNPAQAFLMETNSTFENMFVISHVVGHSDFFARNAQFAQTGARFDQTVGVLADHIREFELEHGRFVVEEFIDKVLTISNHVSRNALIKDKDRDYVLSQEKDPYDDLFPEQVDLAEAERREWRNTVRYRSYPLEPTEDLLGWIAQHGNLQGWEREIVWGMRAESLYFLPQRKTKIMNEGWASIIHRCMMHASDTEEDAGGISFAALHSGVFREGGGGLNPYILGYNIFWDIIQTFGEHTDREMDEFAFIGGPGWEKALEIVEVENDTSFVSNYLTEKVCKKMDLFEFGFETEPKHWIITSKEWEKVRDTLIRDLGDFGVPQIFVMQGAPNRTLELRNMSEKALDDIYAKNTLDAVSDLWGYGGVVLRSPEGNHEVEYSQDENGKIVKKTL